MVRAGGLVLFTGRTLSSSETAKPAPVHEALAALEAADPRTREMVNLFYFARLTAKRALR
ncbi:MAG: hypothetical protein R3F56_24620 [Planctomycetota bacterium]